MPRVFSINIYIDNLKIALCPYCDGKEELIYHGVAKDRTKCGTLLYTLCIDGKQSKEKEMELSSWDCPVFATRTYRFPEGY